ncbi:hypothetical protein MRX96_046244 [Rhipicephalus microplus]
MHRRLCRASYDSCRTMLQSFADRETMLVKNIIPVVRKEYQSMTHVQVKITLSDEFFRDESARGVKLSAMDGRVSVTNTLE